MPDAPLTENVIRPTAIGKKNWLFIGAEGAGQSSAILFTLVAECRRLGLNPQDYFTAALTRLPSATTSDVGYLTASPRPAPVPLGTRQPSSRCLSPNHHKYRRPRLRYL